MEFDAFKRKFFIMKMLFILAAMVGPFSMQDILVIIAILVWRLPEIISAWRSTNRVSQQSTIVVVPMNCRRTAKRLVMLK